MTPKKGTPADCVLWGAAEFPPTARRGRALSSPCCLLFSSTAPAQAPGPAPARLLSTPAACVLWGALLRKRPSASGRRERSSSLGIAEEPSVSPGGNRGSPRRLWRGFGREDSRPQQSRGLTQGARRSSGPRPPAALHPRRSERTGLLLPPPAQGGGGPASPGALSFSDAWEHKAAVAA